MVKALRSGSTLRQWYVDQTPNFRRTPKPRKPTNPKVVRIPMSQKANRMKLLGIVLIILAIFGAFIFVPTGSPESYGRVSHPTWEIIFFTESDNVIDLPRWMLQTLILGGTGLYCLRLAKVKESGDT